MNNAQIARQLAELADLLELDGEAVFKLRAYRNAAAAIADLPASVADEIAAGRDITRFDGIGKSIAALCAELVTTGHMRKLDELLEKTPRSVLDLARIPKVGPKKAVALHRQLGISTVAELRTACQQGKVRELDGFGEKTESAILAGLEKLNLTDRRILWSEAEAVADDLRSYMAGLKTGGNLPAFERMEFAGSFRRGRETVGDLDLLVVSTAAEAVMDRFTSWPLTGEIVSRGPTRTSIRTADGLQVDLRVVPGESFGAALQYFTGSKEHNVAVRQIAKSRGLKLNEYGLFDSQEHLLPDVSGDEARVYAALGLAWIPPELRENRQEIAWAADGQLPELVTERDICGDLHMHTTATDGRNTIAEMAAAARARGLDYIAITDHSKRVTMARGLDAERLLAQWREIDAFNSASDGGILVLKGIECDILEAGGMDLPDEVLAQADWVIASLHYGQNQSRQQITDRITGALRNPHVWIVAHPTGRLLGRRPAYDVDLEAVFQAAAENRKFLELNCSPQRLDLDDHNLLAARRHGIPIVISTDAHQTGELAELRHGIRQARRAALTADDVANTRPWTAVRSLAGRT